MTDPRDHVAIVAAWLEDGPDMLPESTRRAIAVATRTTHQSRRRNWMPRRFPNVNGLTGLALAILAVVVVAVGGLYVLNRDPDRPGNVGGSTSPPPTATDSPAPSPTTSLLDTSNWVAYTSGRYGFTISHPASWTEVPSDHDWTLANDADRLTTAAEVFYPSVGQDVRVSAWSVALVAGRTVETWADLEAWINEYCKQADTGPCAGIHDRVVPLCNEKYDCHPALLVPFENDVQAFFTGGGQQAMVVVAVWRGESEPAVAPYGGSRRLLEAFLSTMGVVPADTSPYSGNRDAAASFLATGH